jgi:Pyruvate/2-oxoacid:ferredoxin oxidoreductase gamma subunit
MASVQGKKGAAGDYAFALFRCREITEEKWNTLTPAFLKLVDGYLQGLNDYAKKHPEEIIHKKLEFYVINASKVAKDNGMGSRINSILQTCFFAISNVMPKDEAIQYIKNAIKKTYGRKGDEVVQKNFRSVDQSLEGWCGR